jgi:hypothetical protein
MGGSIILRRKCGTPRGSSDKMFKTIPRSDRTQLGFTEAVLAAFDFLTNQYGFRVKRIEPTFVRYESPLVFVNIYHGRASYELGVQIGRLADDLSQEESAFSLADILDLNGAQDETCHALLQASTPETINKSVPLLASQIRRHAAPVLRGDPDVLAQLADVQSKKSDQLAKKWKLEDIRKEAQDAWHQKNYARVAELFDSIMEELTPAEAKKLDYARLRAAK